MTDVLDVDIGTISGFLEAAALRAGDMALRGYSAKAIPDCEEGENRVFGALQG